MDCWACFHARLLPQLCFLNTVASIPLPQATVCLVSCNNTVYSNGYSADRRRVSYFVCMVIVHTLHDYIGVRVRFGNPPFVHGRVLSQTRGAGSRPRTNIIPYQKIEPGLPIAAPHTLNSSI